MQSHTFGQKNLNNHIDAIKNMSDFNLKLENKMIKTNKVAIQEINDLVQKVNEKDLLINELN